MCDAFFLNGLQKALRRYAKEQVGVPERQQ